MTNPTPYNPLRSFGRSYTKKFGLLNRNPYHSELTLLQSRILFEVHQLGEISGADLIRNLEIDKGYLSRSIQQLATAGLLKSRENPLDKRAKFLKLTSKGEKLFKEIDRVSHSRSMAYANSMPPSTFQTLAKHLSSANLLMGEEPLQKNEIQLRGLRPGDLGWVISRHGEVYNQEFGWNMDFETLVGEIAVAYAKNHDPKKENAWIAEARGVRLGCIFLVKESDHVAKLRILLVDPMGRGLGLGTRLVRECLKFAKKAKYKKVTLWTNSVLDSARRIYLAEGFQLVREEPHKSFGKNLVGQFWALDLK